MDGKKKWLTQLLVFGVTFIVAFFVARLIFSNGKSYSEQLVAIADAMNKKTPLMIDAETRLDNVKALGDTLQYEYTLVSIAKADKPDIAGAGKFLMEQAQHNLDSSPEMKDYRENAISLKYHYRDKNGEELLIFTISPGNEPKSKEAK